MDYENREIPEEHRVIEIDGVRAELIVQEGRQTVFIEHIEATSTGEGAGSKLLDLIKITYPDFTIEGTAMPYDRDNPYPEPTDEDLEKVVMLESEADYRELTTEERSLIEQTRSAHKKNRGFNPHARLIHFYRKNHFEVDAGAHFISRPPHRLSGSSST